MAKSNNGPRVGEVILTVASIASVTGVVREDTPAHVVLRHKPRGQRSMMDGIIQYANIRSKTFDEASGETTILHVTNVELLRLVGSVLTRPEGVTVYYEKHGKKLETFVPNQPGLIVNLDPDDEDDGAVDKKASKKTKKTDKEKPDAAATTTAAKKPAAKPKAKTA